MTTEPTSTAAESGLPVEPSSAVPASPPARRRPWWRRGVSLRTLMGLVLLVACGLGLLTNGIAKRVRALAAVRAMGSEINWQDDDELDAVWARLYRWTGADFCRSVDHVYCRDNDPGATPPAAVPPETSVAGQITGAVAQLPEVRGVMVKGWPVAASELADLAPTAVTTLWLYQVPKLIDDRPEVAPLLPRLESIYLGATHDRDLPRSTLALLGRMPALNEIILRSPIATPSCADLAALTQLNRLQILDLHRTVIDDSCLGWLDKLPPLKRLKLGGARVSDATLAQIVARHPNLEVIDLDGSALTDSGVGFLTRLPDLQYLYLRGRHDAPGHLTDAALMTLAHISKLEGLVVTCGEFGGPGLAALRDGSYSQLGLGAIAAGQAPAVIRLLKDHKVDFLTLSGPGVTDDVVSSLMLHDHFGRQLRVLNLADSALTDIGLVQLASLPTTTLLRLDRTAITDAGLANLPRQFAIFRLRIRDTKVTPAGMAAFAQLHPSVFDPFDDSDYPSDDF